MHGQPCPVLVPHPRGRRGDAGDMVFLETTYRAFKCWPEGSRRGARAGVRSWVEQPQAPQAPGRVLHPRPPPPAPSAPSWRLPAGRGRRPCRPPAPGRKRGPGPRRQPPCRCFLGVRDGGAVGAFRPQALPSFSGGGCPGGGALAVALELASTPWRSGRCSRLASCARSLGPGPTHLLTRASWRGGGRVHPRAPGPFSTLRSPAASRGHFLRPGVYFRGSG